MKKYLIPLTCLLIFISFALSETVYAQSDFTKPKEEKKSKKSKSREVVYELPPAKGPKKNIAVMDFENKAGVSSNWNIGTGMAEMLTTSLFNTGRFTVVERKAVGDVLAEQDFGASGRTTSAGAAKIGKILNAQVLIRGAITEFGQRTQGGGSAFSFKGINLGVESTSAHVGVNIRMYDATTGEVIESIKCEGKASAGGIKGGYSGSGLGGAHFGTGAFQKTPLGKATQQVIDKAVREIVRKMDRIPWEGKIVKVAGDTIYLNAGSDSNIFGGDEFTVFSKGEELIDPDTGICLGSEDTKVGRIQVFEVDEKFAKARVTAGSIAAFKRGDIVRQD